MGISIDRALVMVKQRKDRMPGVSVRDDYYIARIEAAVSELERSGIHLVDDIADLMLVVDMTVWQINNRDKSGDQPGWLRLAIRQRWLNDRAINEKQESGDEQ
ncbi:MAG: hypothetical protein J6K55_12545 [Clostridia bacterium]|nr:hypothetical protein [Clostridia bacterium]